jgi:eukaryotic-like serine/threonine-protein kinase
MIPGSAGVLAGLLFFAVAKLPAGTPALPGTSSWPMFRADAALTGRAAGNLPANPKPLWKFKTRKAITSTAAIVDGAVYVGSQDGNLYALELATGKLRWSYKATDEIKSSPAVRDGAVYFGDEMGTFHAVDARTGARRWTFKAGSGITSSANFIAKAGCLAVGSYDQFLYCLSPRDGAVVWKVETEGYVHGTPAVAGERVISAGCDGFLRVLNAGNGKELRRVQLGGYVGASPAVAGSRAYVGTFENEFLAIDLEGGKVLWRYEHPVRKFPFYSSPALIGDSGGTVVFGGRDKLVHALDAATGKERWTFAARSAVDASPAVLGNRVFAADKSGQLFALDAASGRPVWRFDAGAGIEASPAIASGRLVIGATDGVLYCFGAK